MVWADGDHGDVDLQGFLDFPDVVLRILREVFVIQDIGDIFLPTRKSLIDWLHFSISGYVAWHIVDCFAIDLITGANLDFIKSAENVEKHQTDVSDARDVLNILQDGKVKPANAARSLGNGAIFMAFFSDLIADLIVEFGWEWAFANAGGVGLHNAENSTDGGKWKTGVDRDSGG